MTICKDKDIYVVVSETDGSYFEPHGGPLVWEQYTNSADLESIKKRASTIGDRYGKVEIAKLQFDLDQNDIAIRLLGDKQKISDLVASLHGIAVDVSTTEYGLPIYDEGSEALLEMAVLKWVAGL